MTVMIDNCLLILNGSGQGAEQNMSRVLLFSSISIQRKRGVFYMNIYCTTEHRHHNRKSRGT